MLFVTKYSVRGERTKERIGALLSVFGERGDIPGTVAHYSSLDGSFGLVIIDSDDQAELYQATLAYQEWLDFDITPIMAIEDGIPHVAAWLA